MCVRRGNFFGDCAPEGLFPVTPAREILLEGTIGVSWRDRSDVGEVVALSKFSTPFPHVIHRVFHNW